MNNPLPPSDLELLSAYLDEQLKPRQRRRLEARLDNEPQLRKALLGLRRTRLALRSVPQLRAPRNFTLSPEMAGMKMRSSRWFPSMRLASALATLLFVVVTLGDALVGGGLPVAQAPAVEQPMALQAAETADEKSFAPPELAEEEAAPPLLEVESAPAEDNAEEQERIEMQVLPSPSPEDESQGFGAAAEPAEPQEEEGEMDLTESAESQLADTPPPMPTRPPSETPTPIPTTTATLAPTPSASLVPIDTVEAAAESQLLEPTQEAIALQPAAEPGALARLYQLPPIRFVEAGLALVALLTAGAALLLQRRS